MFFFTHPRNAGRHNLRCPFGCREAHRKEQSAQRSAAYYRDPKGKRKKSDLNQRRKSASACAGARPQPARKVPAGKPAAVQANPVIVEHVRMVVSLIEGRRISRRAILQMLAKNLRQHTMVRRRRIDQAVLWLNEQPP
jgi:hypothetical protein